MSRRPPRDFDGVGEPQGGEPDPEELQALDAFLDALAASLPVPAAVSAGVQPGLVAVAGRLVRLPETEWDAVAPLYQPPVVEMAPVVEIDRARRLWSASRRRPPSRPLSRRSAVVAWVASAAAVLVVLAVVAANTFSGQPPTRPVTGVPTVPAPWRLAGFIDQAAWQPVASATLGASVSVTCPTTARCYADDLGGNGASVVEVTTDAGAHWQPSSLPVEARPTSALACPSAADCFVATTAEDPSGVSMLATSDGGASWTVLPVPGVAELVSLACPSTTDCVAAGYGPTTTASSDGTPTVVRTTDGGTSWSTVTLPGDFSPSWPGGLTCDGGNCQLVGTDEVVSDTPATSGATGAAFFSTDGGDSWSPSTVPGGVAIVRAVSCASTSDCVAIGNSVLASASAEIGHPYGPSVAFITGDGGRTWTLGGSIEGGDDYLTGVDCPAAGSCWASGFRRTPSQSAAPPEGTIVVTTDGGTTWSAETLPTALTPAQQQATKLTSLDIEDVSSVSCPTAAQCLAVAATGSSATPTQQHLALGN